jgi:hydroxypyruvate isomerase
MFQLAVCAEMVFRHLPFVERVKKIADLGFQVEIWDWTKRDIAELAATGASFSSMTGYIGRPDHGAWCRRTSANSGAIHRDSEAVGLCPFEPAWYGLE